MLPSSPLTRTLATGAVLAGLAAAAPTAGAATTCPDAEARPGTVSTQRAAESIRCLVNVERTRRGRVALDSNPKLTSTARSYSRQLVSQRFFAHQAPSGSTPTSRIRSTGYLSGVSRWQIGENLAWGERSLGTPAALVRAWMKSPGHRTTMLTPAYREIGIGVAAGSPTGGRSAGSVTVSSSYGLAVPRRARR